MGDVAAGDTLLEQRVQRRAALGGELGENARHVLVVDGRGGQLAQRPPGARILQRGDAGVVTGTVLECAGGANLTVGALAS